MFKVVRCTGQDQSSSRLDKRARKRNGSVLPRKFCTAGRGRSMGNSSIGSGPDSRSSQYARCRSPSGPRSICASHSTNSWYEGGGGGNIAGMPTLFAMSRDWSSSMMIAIDHRSMAM